MFLAASVHRVILRIDSAPTRPLTRAAGPNSIPFLCTANPQFWEGPAQQQTVVVVQQPVQMMAQATGVVQQQPMAAQVVQQQPMAAVVVQQQPLPVVMAQAMPAGGKQQGP